MYVSTKHWADNPLGRLRREIASLLISIDKEPAASERAKLQSFLETIRKREATMVPIFGQ